MALDDYTFTTALTTAVTDSFTEETTNELAVDVDVTDALNEETTLTDVGNTDLDLTDSFHEDSYNTEMDAEHSGNQNSYNDTITATDSSTNDNSINAGVRSYNTGFGEVSFGAAAAGGAGAGDLTVTNHSTIVDQSSNGNVAAFGPVSQGAENSSVVASGGDAMAAGGDIHVDTYVEDGLHIDAGGDVLIDSSQELDVDINSGNQYDFAYTDTDNSIDLDVDDSWNSEEWNATVTDSFDEESLVFSETNAEIDVNAVVGGYGAGIADGVDVAL